MEIDNETLLELLNEEGLNDFSILEKVAKKILLSNDRKLAPQFFNKLTFSFYSNTEGYRIQLLMKLEELLDSLTLDEIVHFCFDSLVGNYLIIYLLQKKIAIIDINSARYVSNIISMCNHLNDVSIFGFPYPEQMVLQLDEHITDLSQNELRNFAVVCNFLFQIDLISKSRETVDSFYNLYNAITKPEYAIRANLIKSLLVKNQIQFSILLEKVSELKTCTSDELLPEYSEIWKILEKLFLPVYFSIDNLRFNGVLYNDNFYFLRYQTISGIEKLIFPFDQVQLSDVNKIFDPKANIFYTPKERYGRLLLRDVYSFNNIQNVGTPSSEEITKVALMSEDDIEERIRTILGDVNQTNHTPIEIIDILTQHLYVNNENDLRFSGFILKGPSFNCVHLNDVAGQIMKACFSPAKMIFMIYSTKIDDPAQSYFIKMCETTQKNYCICDRNELTRLFVAYDVL